MIVNYNKPAYFSNIWSSNTTALQAQAVARWQFVSIPFAILLLGPGTSLSAGNGTVSTTGAIVVNSNSATGGNTQPNGGVSAPQIRFGGSPGYSGNFSGTILTNQAPTADPLLYLQEPSSAAQPKQTGPFNFKGNQM